MKKKRNKRPSKVKKLVPKEPVNIGIFKLLISQLKDFVRKKLRVILSMTSLGFLITAVAAYRSEISGKINELLHRQTQEIVESSKKEIVDSLEYYKHKVNVIEKELQFSREIQKGVILSELGKLQSQIDSIFTLALNESDLDQKIDLYTKIINLTGYCAEAFNNRAIAYRDKYLFDKAIADYNIAVALNPKDIAVIRNRGLVYCLEGEYKKSKEDFEYCLSLEPTDGTLYKDIGTLLVFQKKYDASISYFLKAIELLPEERDTYGALQNAYIKTGNLKQALACSKKMIEIAPDYYASYSGMGNILERMKECVPAIEAYTRAIELNDGKDGKMLSTIYNDRAFVYINNYDICSKLPDYRERVLSDCDSAILLNNQNSKAYMNKGTLYYLEGNLEQAVLNCYEACKISPERQTFSTLLSFYRILYGDERLSMECDKLLETDSQNSVAYYWKAVTLLEKDDLATALEFINKSLEITSDESCYDLKIQCLIDMSRHEEALQVVDSLLRMNDLIPVTLSELYLRKGELVYKLYGKFGINNAMQYCNAAIELRPDCGEYYYFRGRLNYSIGDLQHAIEDLSKTLSLMPDSRKAYESRAECYNITGDYEKAEKDLDRAAQCLENSSKIQIYFQRSSEDMTIIDGKYIAGD